MTGADRGAWLGFTHLGLLHALRDGQARGRSELVTGAYPPIHPSLIIPRERSLPQIAAALAEHGLLERTTSGGPKSKTRPMYRITPDGERTIDAWLAQRHPR